MSEEGQPIVPQDGESLDSLLNELTPRNRAFLNYMLEGHNAVTAYKLAGYEGQPHTAHQLKWNLRRYFRPMAEARGMSAEDLLMKMAELAEKKLVRYTKDDRAVEIEGITVDQAIKLMALRKDILVLENEKKIKKTPTRIEITNNVYEAPVRASEVPIDTDTVK
jgi:hypothetical protein